jgi:hypothetical protein
VWSACFCRCLLLLCQFGGRVLAETVLAETSCKRPNNPLSYHPSICMCVQGQSSRGTLFKATHQRMTYADTSLYATILGVASVTMDNSSDRETDMCLLPLFGGSGGRGKYLRLLKVHPNGLPGGAARVVLCGERQVSSRVMNSVCNSLWVIVGLVGIQTDSYFHTQRISRTASASAWSRIEARCCRMPRHLHGNSWLATVGRLRAVPLAKTRVDLCGSCYRCSRPSSAGMPHTHQHARTHTHTLTYSYTLTYHFTYARCTQQQQLRRARHRPLKASPHLNLPGPSTKSKATFILIVI